MMYLVWTPRSRGDDGTAQVALSSIARRHHRSRASRPWCISTQPAFLLNRYLVAIDMQDSLWDAREVHTVDALPIGWEATPPGQVSLDFGDSWLSSERSPLLVLPSAIVPEDAVVLINPLHPEADGIFATKATAWIPRRWWPTSSRLDATEDCHRANKVVT